jgi:heme-degrading monooxygenase HmoA
MISTTPSAPYYAVIFTSVRTSIDDDYGDVAQEMIDLAAAQEGFLGVESARNEVGITVSYWQSLDAILNWKANTRHLLAQKRGRDLWYEHYKVRICKVERDYDFNLS